MIIWRPKRKNEPQKGIDEAGNSYMIGLSKVVVCQTPQGFIGCGESTPAALTMAMKGSIPTIVCPHCTEADDLEYWGNRLRNLTRQSCGFMVVL